MKRLFEFLQVYSGAVQRACDIGAKIVMIAVGGMIIGRRIIEKCEEAKESASETDGSRPIGFRVGSREAAKKVSQ
mgnify:CR=1 FL=1